MIDAPEIARLYIRAQSEPSPENTAALIDHLTDHAVLKGRGTFTGREAIAQHVWDESFDAFTNVIDVYVKRLRAKLDTGGAPRLIHTRRGEGYQLSAAGRS